MANTQQEQQQTEQQHQQKVMIQYQESTMSEIKDVESGHDGHSSDNKSDRSSSSNSETLMTTMALSSPLNSPPQQQLSPSSHQHPKAETEHLGRHRQYWRDMILGVNDGLVSTFLLISGVVGGGLSSTDVLLTAIAGGIAGAVSMSAGEFIATKSQNQVLRGEVDLERSHIRKYKPDELHEVAELLETIGIPSSAVELRQQILSHYESDSDALLKIMVALEFGVVEEEERSPRMAGVASGLLFLLGALPPILPFCFRDQSSETSQLIGSAVATCVALLVVGGVKTWATRSNWLVSSLENLFVASFGGGFAYGVGMLFDSILREA